MQVDDETNRLQQWRQTHRTSSAGAMCQAGETRRILPARRLALVVAVRVVALVLISADVITGGGMFGIDARVAAAVRSAPPDALGLARLGQLLGQRWLLALALLATAGSYDHLAADPRDRTSVG